MFRGRNKLPKHLLKTKMRNVMKSNLNLSIVINNPRNNENDTYKEVIFKGLCMGNSFMDYGCDFSRE